ncbi:site-specific DNA-methyltransferase [Gallibacterium genomosp. 1]|uniref:site-specific DNA-methyltransferase n=1 Tax=Gallibacterium genomosp. 1 TaxID=155515 RepID=UPI000A80BEA5
MLGGGGNLAEQNLEKFQQNQPHLVVDTSLYPPRYQQKLLTQLTDILDLDANTDGVLIHSDNFQALNLLQARYRGQVKCIYIDPPYNTGNDGFIYKDNYQHSSWLTTMENRLQAAYSLLRQDGVNFISIDDTEQPHLRLLCDQIFMKNGFVTTIHCQMSTTQGMKVKSAQSGNIVKNAEYILCYSKDGHQNIAKTLIYDPRPKYDEHYSLYLKEDGTIGNISELYDYKFPKDLNNKKALSLSEAYAKSEEFADIVRSHLADIVRSDKIGNVDISDLKNGYWKKVQHNGREYLLTLDKKGKICQLLRLKDSWGKADDFYQSEGLRKIRGDWWEGFYIDMGNVSKEGKVEFKNGKKPIRLISQLSKMVSEKNDVVLDFFAGSGTTAHAIIKLNLEDNGNRKYILVEQGEYFDTVLKPRVQKVIYSENWKNGKPMPSEKASDGFNGVSQIVKVLKLESYEDTLNNLELKGQADFIGGLPENVQADYLLRYLLDVESKGSLLNSDDFTHPFDYCLNIATDSAGAYAKTNIDLVETFNYLLGLSVQGITDEREKRGYVMVEGALPNGDRCLIVWRDVEKMGYAEVAQCFNAQNINPNSDQYDVVYLNGDHDMASLWQNEDGTESRLSLRAIEPEFLRLMFAERGE